MSYYTSDYLVAEGMLLKEHFLYVQDGIIQEIAPLQRLNPRAFRDMVAFEDAILIPGLVNARFQSLSPQSLSPQNLLPQAEPYLARTSGFSQASFNRSDAYIWQYAQALEQGVTTLCDTLPQGETSEFTQPVYARLEAAKRCGIRLALFVPLLEGSAPPLESLSRFAKLYQDLKHHESVKLIPWIPNLESALPHWKALTRLLDTLNTVIHLQLPDTPAVWNRWLAQYQVPPVVYLEANQGLDPRFVFVGAGLLSDLEFQILKRLGCGLLEMPSETLLKGLPLLRFPSAFENSLPVALGSGTYASNPSLSWWLECRSAYINAIRPQATEAYLSESRVKPKLPSSASFFSQLTRSLAKTLDLSVGDLTPASRADFLVLDSHWFPSGLDLETLLDTLVKGAGQMPLQAVYVGGNRVMDTGELLTVSLAHRQQARLKTLERLAKESTTSPVAAQFFKPS
jgi:cytosine/adenosine deaminase-related metal-dependent hydrolase